MCNVQDPMGKNRALVETFTLTQDLGFPYSSPTMRNKPKYFDSLGKVTGKRK